MSTNERTYTIDMLNKKTGKWQVYPRDRQPSTERWALEIELKCMRDTSPRVQFRIAEIAAGCVPEAGK